MIRTQITKRIAVKLAHPEGIHVHDGPGFHSEQVKQSSSFVNLTSFFAFIVIYSKSEKVTNLNSYKEKRIHHRSFDFTIKFIQKSKTMVLPPCFTFAPHQKQRMMRSDSHAVTNESTIGNMVDQGNKHCVYKIISETGFVNLSVTQLLYSGNAWYFPDPTKDDICFEGGVAVIDKHERRLCNNFSTSLNTGMNLLPHLVSETRNGITVVVYSFEHYSQVMVEATVSSSLCQGAHPKKCKYHGLTQKWHSLVALKTDNAYDLWTFGLGVQWVEQKTGYWYQGHCEGFDVTRGALLSVYMSCMHIG